MGIAGGSEAFYRETVRKETVRDQQEWANHRNLFVRMPDYEREGEPLTLRETKDSGQR